MPEGGQLEVKVSSAEADDTALLLLPMALLSVTVAVASPAAPPENQVEHYYELRCDMRSKDTQLPKETI
jgi:hypothetical protein